MKEQKTYKTKQRELILACFKENSQRHLTAEDITDYLKQKSEAVGKTTVYRALDKLISEGAVRKYVTEEGKSACYQYIDENMNCGEHFHLKCTRCNRLFHVDCDYLNELGNHIFEHHKFTVDNTKTVLYGICEECRKNEKD